MDSDPITSGTSEAAHRLPRAPVQSLGRSSMIARSRFLLASAVLISIPVGAGLLASAQEGNKLDADRIAAAAGAKATTTDDGVVRIAWPRNDVPLKVDGMPLKPFAG